MKNRWLWCVIAALVAATACRKDKETKTEAREEVPATAKAPPRPANLPKRPVPLEQIPTEEDYELDAARDITSANLEDELDRLEKELQGQ